MEPILVLDHLLPDPDAYRAAALQRPFGDVTLGADTFKGIALCPDAAVVTALLATFPDLEPTLSFFRQSPAGQAEPTYLHSDADMGDWTGIYYLNPAPAPHDGTIFWERVDSGAQRGPWNAETQAAARDGALWFPRQWVEGRYNRLLLFQSDLFHSRALVDNYGTGDGARLVQVLFGRGLWPSEGHA